MNTSMQPVKRGFEPVSVPDNDLPPGRHGSGALIKDSLEPMRAFHMAAVRENGFELQWIEDPDEELQLAAVAQNGSAILCIENPSEAVQIAAVTQSHEAIHRIKDPSDAVKLAAVTSNGEAIFYMHDLCDAHLERAMFTTPSIVFDAEMHLHEDRITAAFLDAISPGLSASVARIKNLVGDPTARADLFRAAMGTPSPEMALDHLDFVVER